MLQIKYFPGEGYNLQYMPDYRFYCDDKIWRPLSSLYADYPYRTRVWFPYKNLKLHFDYMPSRYPFSIQRTSRVLYFQPLRDILGRNEINL
ncbi:hypothetical protein NQ315_007311 [Exocentrus adspersus]|uniref:Uncharacterized protein n=1 Tax=Exocentrus adspersus TaxID=1586481 RepID=A0AAV8WDV1_9CUCU|nr:hypothetical protein NQ315_007311 [Exocentrus adspersus]